MNPSENTTLLTVQVATPDRGFSMKPDEESFDGGVSFAVLERVSSHLGADVFDLNSLATVIDPDVLEAFVATDSILPDSELRFRYEGCTVEVTGDGDISVGDYDGR
jgi:hypothetical protein